MARVFGLLGSGEFMPWAAEADRRMLERATGDGRVLVLPAASAPEGDEVFERWARMGLDHYGALEAPAEVVPLKTREDAEREDLAERVRGASLAFFSGGNPAYLARTLIGTRFWTALQNEMARGMAFGGCSAGVACLGIEAFDSATEDIAAVWQPGLALLPRAIVGPHWNMLDSWEPGMTRKLERKTGPGRCLLALDEDTAIVGDGVRWEVVGAGCAGVYEDTEWRRWAPGARFEYDLLAAGDAASAR